MRSMRNVRLLVLLPMLVGGPASPSQNRPGPEPSVFGRGVISTGDMELNAAFTPDGRTLYFTKRTPKPQRWVILESHLRGSRWSEPQVAPFSGQYNDFDPFISPDGSKLYYSSTRPVNGSQPKRDFDIWVLDRTPSGWSAPRHLDAPVNSDSDEYYPSVSANGTLYFASPREGGKGRADIYSARWTGSEYAAPENLGDAVNGSLSEGDPYITPDDSLLIFVSYGRPEGLGDGDLYISHRAGGQWSKAVNLGPGINSSALDFCPIATADGKTFFFTSERAVGLPADRRVNYNELLENIRGVGNGFGDIYQVDFNTLKVNSRRTSN